MDFYTDIAHQLFIGKTKIGETFFKDPFEFIEQHHQRAPFKGTVFYSNLLLALPNHFGAKMYPDRFRKLADYCGSKIAEYTPASKAAPTGAPLTLPDQMMRDLQVIEAIFQAQCSVYDSSNPFPYPLILDAHGKSGVDGRYINFMDLCTTDELFPLARYKAHFTERFEGTSNLALVKNQLSQLQKKAAAVVGFYTQQLSEHSERVIRYRQEIPVQFEEAVNFKQHHAAVVLVGDHRINSIYLGVDKATISQRFIRTEAYPFNYIATNWDLALQAQSVVEFIDQFHPATNKVSRLKAAIPECPPDLSALFTHSGDFQRAIDALKTIQVIDAECHNRIGVQLKGVIQVWVAILRRKHLINIVSDKALTELLNLQFPDLHLSEKTDGRHFRNRNKDAFSKYEVKLSALLET
jgi:hypothetical protein